MIVDRYPLDIPPPLPTKDPPGHNLPASIANHIHCDVVVIGNGVAGQAAAVEAEHKGCKVVILDDKNGQEVIGIYPGPLVVARTNDRILNVCPRQEIVVATGAAEIHPVVEGNQLAGILTARAASELVSVGLDLGRVVAIGTPPENFAFEHAEGELLRFEGETRVKAVIVQSPEGIERRIECNTVSVGLGFSPRDALARMGNGLPVRVVGGAARAADLPQCPTAGTVCHCAQVRVSDLESIHERGFHELELVKRASLAGTGTCQGNVCMPYIRSFLAARGESSQPPFTARPVTRQLTIGEIAAGSYLEATPRTSLDAEHRRLGARMERLGGWWRPWNYGDTTNEYWAVRKHVSLGDVGTLGKMLVSGPDALELLERLYPTKVASLKRGRARYTLLLSERGYVIDDGLICRDDDTRFTLTFTSGGSSFAEMWVRDWAESWKLDVRLLNQTMSLGAINVTGPLSRELLSRAGLDDPPQYMHHSRAAVAGVDCRVFRLSFTGELSYELHHAITDSVTLWHRLLDLGADLGVRPHGLEALLKLRLEKGHILIGQDTEFDSTPRRLNHEWAVKLDKPDFVGKPAILRTNKEPLDRQLAGFEMEGQAPMEGALIWHGKEYAGYVTSSAFSPALDKAIMLGTLKLFNGKLPTEVTIDGRGAHRVSTPFYDPEGTRARI
jgi:glycine cleavage system aminomethyltransferase T